MAISPVLRKRLLAAAGTGALTLALTLLWGQDGLEGRRYVPYRDVAGVLTVCDGHTGADIVRNKTYTDRECDSLLYADLKPIQAKVDSLVTIPLSRYQRAALYSFAYNVGPEAFSKSSLLKKLNAGEKADACNELRRWVYSGGREWKGLMKRRETERALCLTESSNDLKG
ncbi:lysozyme [Pantoea sp. PNA 14-12]|uniref:lysozyme n=1 Tax=Pantoea TaxID=53335 RepID=UPI00106120AB|nr:MULTISPECIES: lysozyme [Pantoea]TDS68025.1 lysozyme [Pantoea sp. PNA 14-12]